ncbi:MAG TPA: DUF3501 family protein [Ideonella sp.]|nr:DUF3501 family protein [Ideonella sp.]
MSDLMTLQAYSLHRQDHRRRLIAHRRLRTVSLGPRLSLQFEDELTVRHQIQEVLWADRAGDPDSVQAEIDTYAHLVPNGTQWKATLMIELPQAEERERLMPLLNDAVHAIYVELRADGHGPVRASAFVNEDLPCRHLGRLSGVHFLRFQLDAAFRAGLARGGDAMLGCAHPSYHWRRMIPPPTLASLCRELVVPGRAAPTELQH